MSPTLYSKRKTNSPAERTDTCCALAKESGLEAYKPLYKSELTPNRRFLYYHDTVCAVHCLGKMTHRAADGGGGAPICLILSGRINQIYFWNYPAATWEPSTRHAP